MIRTGKAILLVVLVSALSLSLSGADVPSTFSATHYYILSLGEIPVDLTDLIQTAQSAGYSIIQYEGAVSTATRAGEVVSDDVLADDAVLVVDNSRFYLRTLSEPVTFAVRPSELGYELMINPQQDLYVNDTLTSILMTLQQLGILGSEVNLDFASFAKADLKGPASPIGVPLDSTLYGLVVSEDWFAYATFKGITQVGLRVEVVAEKIPGGALDDAFAAYVIEETDLLVKLLLPIDQLLTLAQSSSIGYVRMAYQPSIP